MRWHLLCQPLFIAQLKDLRKQTWPFVKHFFACLQNYKSVTTAEVPTAARKGGGPLKETVWRKKTGIYGCLPFSKNLFTVPSLLKSWVNNLKFPHYSKAIKYYIFYIGI